MPEIDVYSLKTRYGELILAESEEQVCLCDWRYRETRQSVDRRIENLLDCRFHYQGDVSGEAAIDNRKIPGLIVRLCNQLNEYFSCRRRIFNLPLQPAGSVFQNEVWSRLQEIPYGKTVSYSELAQRVGRADSTRAVASAVGANALSFLVPCHRVIKASGDMAGYAGSISVKKNILAMEREETQKQVGNQQKQQ